MIDTRNPACDELFDTVTQSLFGIGLQLEHCIESTSDEALGRNLEASVQGIHAIIALVRNRGEIHPQAAGAERR